ncbi:MAG: DUF1289 domain-containing protein [Nitratireductor sp.]
MSQIQSPCTLICQIDLKTGYCYGCARTGDEITNWVNYSDNERTSIMSTLEDRLKTIEKKPRKITKRQKLKQEKLENATNIDTSNHDYSILQFMKKLEGDQKS